MISGGVTFRELNWEVNLYSTWGNIYKWGFNRQIIPEALNKGIFHWNINLVLKIVLEVRSNSNFPVLNVGKFEEELKFSSRNFGNVERLLSYNSLDFDTWKVSNETVSCQVFKINYLICRFSWNLREIQNYLELILLN